MPKIEKFFILLVVSGLIRPLGVFCAEKLALKKSLQIFIFA